MATAFDAGSGVTANEKIALSWLRRAADLGYAEAQYELARRYVLLDGSENVASEGIPWYEKAAQQGHVRAQYALAICLASGTGTAKDQASAYYWMTLSADGGFPKAQHRLRILEEELEPSVLRDARQRLSKHNPTSVID